MLPGDRRRLFMLWPGDVAVVVLQWMEPRQVGRNICQTSCGPIDSK